MSNEESKFTEYAFILGYIDAISRFIFSGSFFWSIAYLALIIAAHNRLKWARIVWTIFLGFGFSGSLILWGIFGIGAFDNIVITIYSLVLTVLLIYLLWRPETNEWYNQRKD